MNIEAELFSKRIGKLEVEQIVAYIQQYPEAEKEIYALTYHENDKVSWHAWWICEALVKKDKSLLNNKQKEIIQYLLKCTHSGKRRIILNILYHLPFSGTLPVDLLNFCLDRMLSPEEAPGVQSICMKLGYVLCKSEPDLLPEFYHYLDNIDEEYYSPAIRSTRRNILKDISKQRKKKK